METEGRCWLPWALRKEEREGCGSNVCGSFQGDEHALEHIVVMDT